MGLQLIFVVETDKKCKSDWIYIMDTVKHFYTFDNYNTKFTPVYLSGKRNYKRKEREVLGLVKKYESQSSKNISKVLYCFDCDNYDRDPEDDRFLREIADYCKTKAGCDLVWFCKDIEDVYLGRRIENKYKKKESETFRNKNLISFVNPLNLKKHSFENSASNIMNILDKYLKRK